MKVDLSTYNQDWYHRGRSGWIVMLWWLVQGTIFRFSLHNMYRYRAFLLRAFGAKIGRNVIIRASAKFHYPWNVEIGENSWIGDSVYLYSLDKIIVSSNCVISQNSYISTGSHNIKSSNFELITKPVIINTGVWVAANSFVNLGVTIGENTVIGSCSNVTKDMPSHHICLGNPCRAVKLRLE